MSEPRSDSKVAAVPDIVVITPKREKQHDWKFIPIEILRNQKKCRRECPFYSYDCFFPKMTDKRDFLKR
jgi:hypothetical protein